MPRVESTNQSGILLDVLRQRFSPKCSLVLVDFKSEKQQSNLYNNYNFVGPPLPRTSLSINSENVDTRIVANSEFLRYSSTCKFVVTEVLQTKLASAFSTNFETFMTPIDKPLTRRDEDYYIFITTLEQVATEIFDSAIGRLLRYKLAISINIHNSKVYSRKAMTYCIYCEKDKVNMIDLSGESKYINVFPDYTRNFHQHKIRVSAPTQYFSMYEMEHKNGIYRHKRGIHTDIFNTMATKLNMSYILQPCPPFGNLSPKGSTGILLPNGTWTGCLGDVIYSISDIGLSCSPKDDRFNFVDFSNPIDYSFIAFTTAKPHPLYSWKVIFTALNPFVWIFLGLSIALTTGVLCVAMGNVSFLKIGLNLTGYFIGQDLTLKPYSLSSKCAYMHWLYYGMVISAAYTCSMKALIISPGNTFVPKTFSELVTSTYRWGGAVTFRAGLGEELFKNSGNPIMQRIYRSMEGDKNEIACTLRELKEEYACFNWDIMEQFYLRTIFADKSGSHPFHVSMETTYFTSLNFITRKREIFRSHFNDYIKRSFDSGLVKKSIDIDWKNFRQEEVIKIGGKMNGLKEITLGLMNQVEGPQPLGLKRIKGSFIILSCGIVSSVLIYVFETVSSKFQSISAFFVLLAVSL